MNYYNSNVLFNKKGDVFMKTTMKKLTALAISAVLALGTIIPVSAAVVEYGEELTNAPDKSNYSQQFSDVSKSYWAFGYIGEMVNRGVLDGYPDGKFYPDKNVSRAEFAKIMTSAASLSVNNYVTWSEYVDVNDHWAAPYVNAASYYLGGYTMNGSKYYQPDNPALREDIAVALVRLKGYSTAGYDLSIIQTMFSDWQSISTSAQPYVAIAVEKGLISGYDDGTFKGQQGITRAEAATLLWRAYQYGNDNKVYEPEILPEIIVTPEPTVAPTPTPTVKPTKTPKQTEEPEDDYYWDDDEEPDDEWDDEDYDVEDVWDDDDDEEDEEDIDPKDGYGWEITTIRGTIGGIDDDSCLTAVEDGVAYVKDNILYKISDAGKKEVIFDCNGIIDTPENDERPKDEKIDNYEIKSFGYNTYNDSWYVFLYGPLDYYIFNTGTCEFIVSDEHKHHNWPMSDSYKWSLRSIEQMHFYRDGGFNNNMFDYTESGMSTPGERNCHFVIKNTSYRSKIGHLINGASNSTVAYGLIDYEIISENKDGDRKLVMEISDVYDETEWFNNKTHLNDNSNFTVSADGEKVYYYDDHHDAMRLIERID